MPIDNSSRPNKISRYTLDPPPYTISFASGNSVSIFTTPYYYPKFSVLTYVVHKTDNIITRDKPGHSTEKIGHFSKRHETLTLSCCYCMFKCM